MKQFIYVIAYNVRSVQVSKVVQLSDHTKVGCTHFKIKMLKCHGAAMLLENQDF